MSCLKYVSASALICLGVAGWATPSRSGEAGEEGKSWYFLGAETDRYGRLQTEAGGSADILRPVSGGINSYGITPYGILAERRALDEFHEGERYTFSFRYSGLDAPTGQIGLGRGPDPYGPGDVMSIYFDHAFDPVTEGGLRPHVVAGVGLALGSGLDRREELAPALELGVGASYALTERWDFFTEYRAFYTGRAEPGLRAAEDDSGLAQNFTLGARLRF